MKQFDFKTRYGIIKVVEDPNLKNEAIVLPYRAGEAIDSGSFYAPYVPLHVTGLASEYWQATGLYENQCPCDLSNVADHVLYQWGVFVQIDGHFAFTQYGQVHAIIYAWALQNGAKLLIDEEMPDIILFYTMEDAMLFRIAFGEPQAL